MKKSLLNLLKFTLFLSFGLFILYLVYQKQNTAYVEECAQRGIPAAECSLFDKVVTDFAQADFFWLGMVLLCFTISNISRAIRWNMLLRQLGTEPRLSNSFLTIVLGYFANLGLPRVGEVVRAGTMARYERLPVEKVMGTVVVDRVIDVICILLVSGLAIVLAYDRIWSFLVANSNLGERLAGSRFVLYGLAAAAVTGAFLLYYFRRPLLDSRLGQKLSGLLQGFAEGLRTVARLDQTGWFVFHSVVIWVMYFLMTYLCFFAYAPTADLAPVAALVTFVFGGWGIVIPSPGGMGTYHFLAQSALLLYGVPGEDGFSWANISFFTIQLGCNVLIGLAALLLLPVLNRDYRPAGVVTT